MSDKIIQRSLVDQVYSLLLKRIQIGELKPGDRLKIEELSREFGVSRTPLREAIGKLTQNGFVVTHHNVGPSVAAYDDKQILQIIEANAILTEDIADLIFDENCYQELIPQLEDIINKQAIALSEDNAKDFFELSIRFHEILINASPNKLLSNYAMSLQIQLDSYVASYQRSNDMRKTSLDDHSALVEAMKKSDKQGFKDALRAHNLAPMEYFGNTGK